MNSFVTWRHTSDIRSKLNYNEILEIIHDGYFTISETNNDLSLLNKSVSISLDDIETSPPSESSQHTVFFGTMKFKGSSELSKICIKFKKPDSEDTSEPKRYGNYTQKHSSYILYNYSKALNYLKKFPGRNSIKINDVFCCETVKKYPTKQSRDFESICFWVESRLDHFNTFWDEGRSTYIEKIITTSVDILREFQIFIYNESGYEHTIIDLQGDKVNEVYILCDIEFTTKDLYEFTPTMMIDTISSLYSLQKTNVGILEKNVTDLSDRISSVEEKISSVEDKISRVEDKISSVEGKMDNMNIMLIEILNRLP